MVIVKQKIRCNLNLAICDKFAKIKYTQPKAHIAMCLQASNYARASYIATTVYIAYVSYIPIANYNLLFSLRLCSQ